MLSGIWLILFFLVMIVVMILAISKLKLHPFLAIMGVAIILAFVAEGAGGNYLNLTQVVTNNNTGLQEVSATARGTIIGSIGVGFSAIFSSIGIVIIFGALIGGVLEATGGAFKIADMIIRLLGKASPTLAILLMGWVVSIPVFCDSGFVIANPVRKSIVKRTRTSGVATAIALGAGLYTSHVLVPLTPGPLAASEMLGLGDQLITVMWVSLIISVPSLIAAYFFAKWRGKKDKSAEDLEIQNDATVKSYEELVKEFGGLPNGFLSIAPILMPVVFMAVGSIVTYNIYDPTNITAFQQTFVFLGAPVVALGIGVLFAVLLLFVSKKMDKFNFTTNETLKMLGPILFITAAGATLGRVINDSDIIPFIRDNAEAITWMGIAFPFVVSAILKTAQGSSTVAMMVTAGIMGGGLMQTMGFDTPISIALVVMAIGAGSMMASHANDSYFWVVSKLSDQTPQQGYKNWTSMTVVQGIACMIGIFIFYGIYQLVS
ncbi:MAG: GntP family permease [Defluviitaleaceae bacterium]|nr:GntP family permease [Defluviitaleaceae bacterium]